MTEIGPTIIEPTAENIRTWLTGRVAHYLDEPAETIDPDAPFAEIGLDSVYAFTLCGEVEDTLSVTVELTSLWEMENLAEFTNHIVNLVARRS
jgi:acyl carrier protein